MKLPRILHLTRRYWPLEGGTERYVGWLAEAQVRRGYEVTVGSLNRDVIDISLARLAATETHDGVRIRRVAGFGGRQWTVVLDIPALLSLIAGADVVHLHDLRFAFASTVIGSSIARRPLILHSHGLIFHTRSMEGLKRFAVAYYFGPILQASNAIIAASSQSDADLLLSLRPQLESQVHVIENAIPIDKYLRIDRHPEPGEILVLGRVADSKRIDLVIHALARVKHEEWHLTIAGSPETRTVESLRAIARQLGVVDRVAFYTDITESAKHAFLARAQFALFPSQGEGFGLALLEAMAAGVPSLAQDIPAHRSLLSPTHLTDFRDPARASRRIKALLEAHGSGATRQLRPGRARHYDLSRLVDEVEDLYQSLGLRTAAAQQQVP